MNNRSAWREKYQDHWFNHREPEATACVARELGQGRDRLWLAINLHLGSVEEFESAEEAMNWVDEHPELFPGRKKF